MEACRNLATASQYQIINIGFNFPIQKPYPLQGLKADKNPERLADGTRENTPDNLRISINHSNELNIIYSTVCRSSEKGSFRKTNYFSVKEKECRLWRVQKTLKIALDLEEQKDVTLKYLKGVP